MQLGMVGLGRMGLNMTRRLVAAGHPVVAFDRNLEAVARAKAAGATGVSSTAELVRRLGAPRIVWLMVPAGDPVDSAIAELQPLLAADDIVIDGGNSNYKDTLRRADALAACGVSLLDVGTSGGIWGLENGYCLMVGGDAGAYDRVEPILRALAQEGGYARVGGSGAGHYAKMIHNGIEYGMLQAYGEGFELLHASPYGFDPGALARLWNHGSVVRSWLLELAERAFENEGADLNALRGYVEDSGEGRWTVQEAIDLNVPAPVLTLSLLARLATRQEDSFSARFIAALRNEFGGHSVRRSAEAAADAGAAPSPR
jgi:6-phosphogluconate dehydrogenase